MNLEIEISDEEIEKFYRLIGFNVKKLRHARGISQLQLALAIGLNSVSTVAKAEIGVENKHFNLEHLYKIAKVLEIELCDFMENSEKKS